MTERFLLSQIPHDIDYINIRYEGTEKKHLFDYWMGFFYYSLSRWVQLNMFYSVCFVPLPCYGTYEEPHLPFTVKWIHRKSFHRGVSRSESKDVWGDRCETQHEPLHPSLSPVCPHLGPWFPTQLSTSLKRACYSHHTESSYRMLVKYTPTIFIVMFTWTILPNVVKVCFKEGSFFFSFFPFFYR